jgi:exopolysaccharide/PEP-CTERM locus tyrosine autokinase
MNKHSTLRASGSLLERAAEMYDFGSNLRGTDAPVEEAQVSKPLEAEAPALEAEASEPRRPKKQIVLSAPEADFLDEPPLVLEPEEAVDTTEPAARPQTARAFTDTRREKAPPHSGRFGKVDRQALREGGFIMPDAPVTGLAEEFRIIKRQLLQAASGKTGIAPDKRQSILVCSPSPDDGKTFCAVNLALSLATEKQVEVLLIDADFSKPEILSILGLEGSEGLMDAIADPSADPESFVIQTDIERLSVLPAGRQTNNVSEMLAAEHTRNVLDALTQRPNRIVVFDSPPALMASPASVLASKVGQVVMVVRADKTKETDLREAIGLLSGCQHVSLMLNGAGFTASSRRFGSYYGYGQ